MTRPIFEPSPARTDARLGYDRNQLQRRPGQTSEGDPIEWIYVNSTTNWAADLTDINWTLGAGSFDTVTPTFDINGDGNLEIMKGGDYYWDYWIIQVENDGSGVVWTHVTTEISRLSGPSPAGWHGWTVATPYATLRTYYIPNSPFADDVGVHFHDFTHWDMDDFVATPTEFLLQAVKWWDGIATADTSVVVRLLVVRIGDAYPVP